MAMGKRASEKRPCLCDTARAILPCVLLISTCLVHSSCSSGAICSSELCGGTCTTTRTPPTDCAMDSNDCRRNPGDPASLYDPGYVDRPMSDECHSYRTSSPSPTHTVARALTVVLYPVGRDKKYSLYVSWQTRNEDTNIEGFDVWNYKCSREACFSPNGTYPNLPYFDRGRFECLPILSPSARSVLFNGATHRSTILQCKDGRNYIGVRCNSQAVMTVVVIPQPLPDSVTFSSLLETSSLTLTWDNLDRCWPTLYNANCSTPVFIRPVLDFNVTTTQHSRELMNIHVVWLPSTGDVEYIVTITDPLINVVPNCTTPGDNPPCFVARNTTQVTISMLNSTKEYSISVQVVPRCNNSSFAEHYVGCRSEECCQAKRVMASSNHSMFPSPSLTSETLLKTAINIVTPSESLKGHGSESLESQTVTRGFPHDANPAKTSRRQQTVDVHPSVTTPTPDSTIAVANTPTDEAQYKPGIDGQRRAVIAGSISFLVVAVFTVCAVITVIFYFARRKMKYHSATSSLTSASSLLESLDSPNGGGRNGERDGGEYCNMFTIEHVGGPPTYSTITTAGACDASGKSSLTSSSESPNLQTSFEFESLTEESQLSTCSDSEKYSGSLSMEDDAFERAVDKPRDSDADNPRAGAASTGSLGVTEEKIPERRSRSESVRVKMNRTSSSSSSKRRPRSFSTSHVTPPHSHSRPPPSALILYSKNTPTVEQRVIQQCLVSDLTHYNIRTVSEDTCSSRECPASWLEAQMRDVSAVFCVCNEAFDREWENKTDGLSGLVPVFKQLCHGLVTPSCGRNQLLRDKIAIVLPHKSDLQFVPTYINSRPKFQLLSQDLEKMVRFVIGIPEYTCITAS